MSRPAGSVEIRTCLIRQHETAWRLTRLHLEGLTDEECLWRPTRGSPTVHRSADGSWRADWPVDERYENGPPSIAWLTWHVQWWWSMVLDHCLGEGTLSREDVAWPGSAHGVRERLAGLEEEWSAALSPLSDEELCATDRTRWPFRGRPLHAVVAWVNLELMKNGAEIGTGRFLYAARTDD